MSSNEKQFLGKKRKDENNPLEIYINEPNKIKKEEPQIKETHDINEKNIIKEKKEINKTSITSISQYYSSLIKEDWKNKIMSDLRKYYDSIEINSYSIYELLKQLLNKDFDLFIDYYSKY